VFGVPSLDEAKYIYLDNNSTTPCASEVVAAMLPYFTLEHGNPASGHIAGSAAASAVERARSQVANAIAAETSCVFFTSGATEANNIAILGIGRAEPSRRKIVVSAVEHKSVLLPAEQLSREGYSVVTVPVERNGLVSLAAAREIVDGETALVSVQAVNNETGVVQPVREVAAIARARGALVHCDAAQALGKVAVNVEAMGVDLASFSAHKLYGPKGIGALFVTRAVRKTHSPTLSWGGGQERGVRPGTVNVPGVVGFGEACRLACVSALEDAKRIGEIREEAEKKLLLGVYGSWINGQEAPRVPGTISLTVPGLPADMVIANLEGVCVGEGAACNSGALEPSHVLLAMGLSRSDAESTIRLSIGRYNDEAGVRRGIKKVIHVCEELKKRLAAGPV
jgi:cysteine desulfurase